MSSERRKNTEAQWQGLIGNNTTKSSTLMDSLVYFSVEFCFIESSVHMIVIFLFFEMLFSYRSEFQFLMGQFPEAKLSYTRYYEFAEPHTAPYLDFVLSKDFSSLHPLTRLNISVSYPLHSSAFMIFFVLILCLIFIGNFENL
jgi:hypothetical protein